MSTAALRAAPALPVYFSEFPLPDRAPYAIAADMAVLRSEMSAGNVRQRRAYKNMPQIFSLSFHLHTDELEIWQYWVNLYAYDWIYLPLASMFSPSADQSPDGIQPRGLVSTHIARFISDLSITMEGFDWWAVTVAAEISPDMFADLPRPSGIDRVDGLHPADALADSLDGRFPSAPAPGGPVDGGTLDSLAAHMAPPANLASFKESLR